MISEEFRELFTVSRVFMDTELEILGELLVEFLVVFLVFCDFSEHFKALLDNILLDNFKNSVLLKSFS